MSVAREMRPKESKQPLHSHRGILPIMAVVISYIPSWDISQTLEHSDSFLASPDTFPLQLKAQAMIFTAYNAQLLSLRKKIPVLQQEHFHLWIIIVQFNS